MAYDKHIFKSGDVLLAAELNTMNNQIELNHDSIQNCYTKEEITNSVLKDYAKSSECITSSDLNNYVTIENLSNTIAQYYTKEEVDSLLSNLISRIETLESSNEPEESNPEEPTDPEETTE